MAGAQKIRLRKHQRRRKPAGADEFLRTVAVHENFVEQRRALNQSRFEFLPFFGRNDERNRVKLPRTLHTARITIDIVSDALLVDEALAGVRTSFQFCGAEFLQRADQLGKMWARLAIVAK